MNSSTPAVSRSNRCAGLSSGRSSSLRKRTTDHGEPVTEAVKKRFPKGELTEASKEEADGKTTYEVSVKLDGKNIDVSLMPEGKITMIEKEIASKDLPKTVTATIEKKYPKATYKLAEEVTVVENGKVRCLAFCGQSNSLFSKEKDGRSDGQYPAHKDQVTTLLL